MKKYDTVFGCKGRICQRCNGTGFEPDHREIGKSLRALRKYSGITLREAAAVIGWSAAYLSDMELGKRDWSADRIERFKKAVA